MDSETTKVYTIKKIEIQNTALKMQIMLKKKTFGPKMLVNKLVVIGTGT